MLISEPLWVWHWLRGSFYHRISHNWHLMRLHEYDWYSLPLNEIIQHSCIPSAIQVDKILTQAQEVGSRRGQHDLKEKSCFDSSNELAQVCYAIARLAKPRIVVETGVARGVTSMFILTALRQNNEGILHSIDLPIPGTEDDVGALVPAHLKDRWTLTLGIEAREMKKMRRKVNEIDVFVHDSDYSYFAQREEFNLAFSWLKRGGILVSDDIGNDAFLEVCDRHHVRPMTLRQSKEGALKNIGIVVK